MAEGRRRSSYTRGDLAYDAAVRAEQNRVRNREEKASLSARIRVLETQLAERDVLVRDAAYLVAHRNHCSGDDPSCPGCQWRARAKGIIEESNDE